MKKKLKREKEENEKLTKQKEEQTFNLTAADNDTDKSQEQTIKSLLGELAMAKNAIN